MILIIADSNLKVTSERTYVHSILQSPSTFVSFEYVHLFFGKISGADNFDENDLVNKAQKLFVNF